MFIFCLRGFFLRKARTFLIALSVAVGVISVILIDSIGSCGTELINAELDSLGISGFSVSKASSDLNSKLNNDDLAAIKAIDSIDSATPVITTTGFLKNDTLPSAVFCGVDHTASNVISLEKLKGEMISYEHTKSSSAVCLIDLKTKEILFGKESKGIGERVDVLLNGKNCSFEVIGTVKSESNILKTSIGEMLPTVIYTPYTTLQKIIGNNSIDQIAVSAKGDNFDGKVIEAALKKAIYSGGNKGRVKISDLNSSREDLNSVLNTVTLILKLIGGISLIVSGLGITTVMLISVGERKKEIGIKKSIGAKKRNIAAEFFTESAVITLIGAVMGIVFSALTLFLLNTFFNLNLTINFKLAGLITAVTTLCGIIFSLYPAFKAAALKPIEAIKEDF